MGFENKALKSAQGHNFPKHRFATLLYLRLAPVLLFLRSNRRIGNKSNRFVANRGSIWRQAGFAGLYSSAALMLFLPARVQAQAKGTVSQNPLSPSTLPIKFANYPRPVRDTVNPIEGRLEQINVTGYVGPQPPPSPTPTPTPIPLTRPPRWSEILSGSYQFLNARSRVGDVSFNSHSGTVDVTIIYNTQDTYTSLDIAYTYGHTSGNSPTGRTETANQNVGSLRVLQPLYFGKGHVDSLSNDPRTHQLAIILDGNYGDSAGSIRIPGLSSIHSSAYTFFGNALLDYQFQWFPRRPPGGPQYSSKCCYSRSDDYPNLLCEFSSGIQFDSTRFDSSNRLFTSTSSAKQLTYTNIGSLTYSFPNRLGFVVAAEWDAPLHSEPLRGSQPYYANTATCTAGLTYNAYQGKRRPGPQGRVPVELEFALFIYCIRSIFRNQPIAGSIFLQVLDSAPTAKTRTDTTVFQAPTHRRKTTAMNMLRPGQKSQGLLTAAFTFCRRL